MIQGFYTASVGSQQQMDKLAIQANNIANVNTYGYKTSNATFGTLMYGMMQGVEGNDIPRGTGVQVVNSPINFDDGGYTQTTRSMDYAIFGDGFFAVQDRESGEVTYTRDGSFTMSMYIENGAEVFYLSDGLGRLVMDETMQPITVTDPNAKQPIGVFDIQYKDGMTHAEGSRFVFAPEKNGTVTPIETEVMQGFLEESNTDLATEMAKVIETQRAYSSALSMMRTADEIETTINSLKR